MISVVDYGAGNLCSVVNALTQLGYSYRITNKPEDVLEADTVILPGVGAANNVMNNLKKLELIEPIKRYTSDGRPFLGICIGLQILLSTTEEGDTQECLGIIPGSVQKFSNNIKVPHMGWNQVRQVITHPIFIGIPDSTNFYFVHSYYAIPQNDKAVIGTTDYSISFASILAQDKLIATQFHPEKSGKWGLKLYDNFLRMAGEKRK